MRPSPIAIHEAGHALVAWLLGGFEVVAFDRPTADRLNSAGNCRYRIPRDANDAAIAMAGREAERLLLGRTSPAHAYIGDAAEAVGYVHGKGGGSLDMSMATVKARVLLTRHKSALGALAARLHVRGIITDHDLAEVTGRTPHADALAKRIAEAITPLLNRKPRTTKASKP